VAGHQNPDQNAFYLVLTQYLLSSTTSVGANLLAMVDALQQIRAVPKPLE